MKYFVNAKFSFINLFRSKNNLRFIKLTKKILFNRLAFTCSKSIQGVSRKSKLLTFSRHWEIRLMFTKVHHYGWRREKKCWCNP